MEETEPAWRELKGRGWVSSKDEEGSGSDSGSDDGGGVG